MELTEEQLKQVIGAAIIENNKLILKDVVHTKDLPPWFDSKVVPPDLSNFVTKEVLQTKLTAMDSVISDAIKKVNEDIQKLIKKVFPEQTQSARGKSQWFAFD